MSGRLALLFLAGCLTACSTPSNKASPIVPQQSLQLTAHNAISMAALLTGAMALGAVHVIFDPLAPNWEIEETRVSETTLRYQLTMKRFHTGGAGESREVLRRRLDALQTEIGFSRWELMEYSEGIDSQTLGARRIASATVRLVR